MFSNVLRNIDWKLLKQQEKSLIDLITEEKLPMNHPLVGLLGMVAGILIERTAGENRVDVSMNYWWKQAENDLPNICINFHPSLYKINWGVRMALCSGLMMSLLGTEEPGAGWDSESDIRMILDMLNDVIGKTILVRFGEQNEQE